MISDVLQSFLNTNDILTFLQTTTCYHLRGHEAGRRKESGVPAFSWAPC